MIDNMLLFLGLNDLDSYKRLKDFESIEVAWAESKNASDMTWLAARIANQITERIAVACAILRIVDLIPAAEEPPETEAQARGLLTRGLTLLKGVTVYDLDAGNLSAIFAELGTLANAARGVLLLSERSRRGAAKFAPFFERAAYHGLVAARLELHGSWRGKASEMARNAIGAAETLIGAQHDVCTLLREDVPFTEFQTSWWGANPPPLAPRL